MPQLVVFALQYITIYLAGVFGTGVLATYAVVKFVALTAASMAASKLLQKKPPGFGDASLADRTQMVRSPISARQIIYGETRVSGTMVYISTTGSKNEYLHFIVAIAGHEVEAIGNVYFNDELALSDPNYTGGGSAGTGRFAGYAEIYKKYGGDTQTVETNLETATAGLTNGKWTSNHRLRGIAYLYVRLIWDEKVWAGGIPNVAVMVRGKKVWDPRTSTVAYSANAALCLRDYLTDTRLGMAMDGTEMDDTAFIAAANICDEQVEIKPVTSPATYENRYEANGVLYTSASPDENIGKLLSAMGGLIAYSGGKVVPYAGGYRIPTVTLSEGDFAGAVQIQTKTSARDRVNAVKGVFVSAKSEWQPTDFPPLVSSTYYAEDGNIRYYRDVVLPMTTSSSCAQRLARIELRRARQEITMTARFKLDAMQLRAGDTVMITNAKFGWSSKVFEVMDWHFASDGEPPQLTIEMTLRETASAVYDWSVTDEIEMPNTPTTTLPNPFTLDAPTNLSLVADGTTQLVQADGTALPRIKVSWSAPAEQFIQSGGTIGIDYKESTSTTYLTWNTLPGDRTTDYISSDVKIGLGYDIRVYGLSYFQIATSYVVASITVQQDTTAPTAPTSLTANVGAGLAVSLDWADSSEPDLSEYGIYRNTTGTTPVDANTDKIAEVRASRFVDTEVAVGTTYYYWVNAYDMLENVSGFSNRAEAIATGVTAGSVDLTPPSTPNAPTFSSESTYVASDGSAFARVTITAPAMPSGGALLVILLRISGSSQWQVANQITQGSIAVSINSLGLGISYEFAAQALSNFEVASSISSVLSRTTPSSTSFITGPVGAYSKGEFADPVFQGQVPMYAIGVSVTAPSDRDVAYVEAKIVNTNSSSATGAAWYANGNLGLFSGPINPSQNQVIYFYDIFGTTGGWGFIRVVSRSGKDSSWQALGLVTDYPSLIKRPIGTISKYNDNDVTTTGLKTGGGSSTRQINVRYEVSEVKSLTGGAATETISIDTTNRGFSAKPDAGWIQCASDSNIIGVYDFDAVGNSSTTSHFNLVTVDGTNIPTGNQRFSIGLVDYS